jgi:hypothetical protein
MHLLLVAFLGLTLCAEAAKLPILRPAQYGGMADASAGAAVSSNLFVVADDEQNILRLYGSDQGGRPVKELDVSAFLEVTDDSPEADLEGCAKVGERIFWIGSHGRNKNGKKRPNRCRFFATDVHMVGNEVELVPTGKPYKLLLEDLRSDARLATFELGQAAGRAPKEPGALNIEGLSATPEGHLLLGFRNPLRGGKALLVPLLNPDEVITGKRAKFGAALQLDLGGLGIRDIAFFGGDYLIIAGPYHEGGPFRIYRWRGEGTQPVDLRVKNLNDYHPEAIVIYPDKGIKEFQVLSDDGKLEIDGVPGKEVPDSTIKSFRSFWLAPISAGR